MSINKMSDIDKTSSFALHATGLKISVRLNNYIYRLQTGVMLSNVNSFGIIPTYMK